MVRNQKVDPAQRAQESGLYTCSGCAQVLFEAKHKFEVGSGFPSFWAQAADHVQHCPLSSYGRHRVQLLCRQCGQHLGHLFRDTRTPTGVRYCINAKSITFEAGQL
ncbi:peptide-methionine (R)-S-oxide reductase [Pontibacter mangrovi]|uniref:peptide-methionine (R)-S-oxide reductase n=1 Tax=Pontibacter mangrovi TaxID=2589816 RepID=UPI001EF130B3|nr:peptide-methionine (R)-S-oxide reductase [Pontibacter mangrovi]